ncbi:extradiol dioxygenase [Serinibacter arcticus]|uniref:Extradiol dioxygenase n=1 Tax=Serinibacter arcticus TaxID=1655435 RepID=A0A2U1ZVQ2_9MICO|nr:VOC family protein [Serinibacter arcticus]PWD51020.1 extradiol dioxygenase [Serinibacter arcticus]
MLTLTLATYLVHDLDDGIAFFVDALGFELREDETRPSGSRWVVVAPSAEGPGLRLAVAGPGDPLGRQAGDGVGFFLRTSDFAAQHARMSAAGVTFLEEPRHEVYGTVAVFADPAGQRWDLIQPAGE